MSCPYNVIRSRSAESCTIAFGRSDHRNDETEHESANVETFAMMWRAESL